MSTKVALDTSVVVAAMLPQHPVMAVVQVNLRDFYRICAGPGFVCSPDEEWMAPRST